MIVAELILISGNYFDDGAKHVIGFNDLTKAKTEYDRIAALMLDEQKRINDKPEMLECIGSHNKVTLPLKDLRSISLVDFAIANEQFKGLRDTFPHLTRS